MDPGRCDELGNEMADDAKVWRYYCNEADEHDKRLIDSWSRSVDVMLIFAGLLSGVLVTFLIDSYKSLQPDPQDTTNALLLGISNSLRSENSTTLGAAPTPQFQPSTSAVWINALWFTSLTCSLGVASVAMLAKQWLNAYIFGLSSVHHTRAQVRQYRYDTLLTWKTHGIISGLPFALSLCLMLFLAGLSIMLFSLNHRIAIISTSLIGATLAFHLLNILLPALCNCPWRTSVSPVMFQLFHPIRHLLGSISRIRFKFFVGQAFQITVIYPLIFLAGVVVMIFWPFYWVGSHIPPLASATKHILRFFGKHLDSVISLPLFIFQGLRSIIISLSVWLRASGSEADQEKNEVLKSKAALDAQALIWLLRSSTKSAVVDCGVQAISGLPSNFDIARLLHQAGVLQMIRDRLRSCFHGDEIRMPVEAEKYTRALLRTHSILRIHNEGRGVESRANDIQLARAFSVTSSSMSSVAAISLLCAGTMLHEMVDVLEKHVEDVIPLSSFHVHLLVDTLGQEAAWRKRSDGDYWTHSDLRGWGGLVSRVLSALIHLLDIRSSSGPSSGKPSTIDTATALTIAMFTKGHPTIDLREYTEESNRQRDFHYLVLIGLNPVLRFPASFQCDAALSSIVRDKYCIALDRFSGSQHPSTFLNNSTLRTLLTSRSSDDRLPFFLSRLNRQVIPSLECTLLLNLLASPDRSEMWYFDLLLCLERMCEESAKGPELARVGVMRTLVSLIRSPNRNLPTKSSAFRVMVWVAHQVNQPSLIEALIRQGLMDGAQDFFNDPGFVRQEDIDRWVNVLMGRQLRASPQLATILRAMMNWAGRHWQGHQLMAKHMQTLEAMAVTLKITVEPIDDTSWFTVTSRSPGKLLLVSR